MILLFRIVIEMVTKRAEKIQHFLNFFVVMVQFAIVVPIFKDRVER